VSVRDGGDCDVVVLDDGVKRMRENFAKRMGGR
jgi:hypothetical protein